MHNRIEIIHEYPTGAHASLQVRGRNSHFFLYFFINAVRDCFDVHVGIALANDKKIGGRIVQVSKIEQYDMFAFFIADTFYDPVIQLFDFVVAFFCDRCYCETQMIKI